MLEFRQLFSYGDACTSNMSETEGHSQTTFLKWTLSLHTHSLRLTDSNLFILVLVTFSQCPTAKFTWLDTKMITSPEYAGSIFQVVVIFTDL